MKIPRSALWIVWVRRKTLTPIAIFCVRSIAEVLSVRQMLDELCQQLGCAAPPLGVMIETPASALLAAHLAAVADFLSIGSNDLAQYTLAMDRGQSELATALDALHPAVLQLIRTTAEAARAAGITPILIDIFAHEDRYCALRARSLSDVIRLADVPAPSGCVPTAINDNGDVVGYATPAGSNRSASCGAPAP